MDARIGASASKPCGDLLCYSSTFFKGPTSEGQKRKDKKKKKSQNRTMSCVIYDGAAHAGSLWLSEFNY